MSELLCTICHQNYTYEKFLVQHCGHAFCEECTSQLILSRERKCPTCRREWGSKLPFRVYLNFPDPDKSIRILRQIDSIDLASPPSSLKKAGAVLKEISNSIDTTIGHDTMILLADAARRLEQRVAPLALELEHTLQDNETMRQRLKNLDAQLKSKDILTAELDRLNRTLMEREVTTTAIRSDLAHEKQKRQFQQDTNRRLTRSLRKKQEELTTKEKTIDSLKSEIQERDKQLSLMKSKLRALVKLTKPPKTTVQNPNDSLVVEHSRSLSDIENSRNVKRPHQPIPGSSKRPPSAVLSLSKRQKIDMM